MKCMCVCDMMIATCYIGSQARTNPSREEVSAPSLQTASRRVRSGWMGADGADDNAPLMESIACEWLFKISTHVPAHRPASCDSISIHNRKSVSNAVRTGATRAEQEHA